MVGPRLPRCSLNYNIPRRVPAMVERDVAGKRIGVVISANGRRRLLFTTNAISFEWNALDTRDRPLSRRGLVVDHARPSRKVTMQSQVGANRDEGEERRGEACVCREFIGDKTRRGSLTARNIRRSSITKGPLFRCRYPRARRFLLGVFASSPSRYGALNERYNDRRSTLIKKPSTG